MSGGPLDPRALVRVLDELLWALRREGFAISTAQAIDAARALEAVGFDRPSLVREAIACLVVTRIEERARFDAAFARFFAPDASRAPGTLWERLQARGFQTNELDALRELLERLGAGSADLVSVAGRGAELDRLLVQSQVARTLDAHSGLMLGYVTHRIASEVGAGRAHGALASLRSALADALGERGHALAAALGEELEGAADDIRTFVKRIHEERVAELDARRRAGGLETTPFASLSDAEIDEVRRAVRRFADRLRGAARVRARHARKGRFDVRRTMRRALRTGGIPFDVVRARRRRDRTKLVVLCDVSDSVRAAAGFLLEFTYAAQELFERARSFVFVSELGETTDLFLRAPVRHAIDLAWRGVVPSGENSNYGRVLRAFEARHLREIDRSTTVVILGDGRTNFHDAAPEVLDRVRSRAHALLWLCPEPRGQWTIGDSAMARYAPRCTAVLEVGCARDLEHAARRLVTR
jgi:uncharacterized protein